MGAGPGARRGDLRVQRMRLRRPHHVVGTPRCVERRAENGWRQRGRLLHHCAGDDPSGVRAMTALD